MPQVQAPEKITQIGPDCHYHLLGTDLPLAMPTSVSVV